MYISMSKKKIKFIIEKYKDYSLVLSDEEILDFEKQLKRKPIQLYVRTIDWMIKNKIEVNYKNISSLIKINITIRNKLRKLVTSLEESIRSQFLDRENISYDDVKSFEKIFHTYFKKINDSNVWSKNEKKLFEKIRGIRNDVSHIGYPIIFNKIESYIESLRELKKLSFIDNTEVENYISEIKEMTFPN